MDAVLQDLGYAARSLRRQPAFALLAIGTLALGIGANAAIFSVVNAVLLRPLGYHRPDRIVALTTQWQKTGRRGTVSAPDFHDWHDGTASFALPRAEVGQGLTTSIAMLIAEELDLPLAKVRVDRLLIPAQQGRQLAHARHEHVCRLLAQPVPAAAEEALAVRPPGVGPREHPQPQ